MRRSLPAASSEPVPGATTPAAARAAARAPLAALAAAGSPSNAAGTPATFAHAAAHGSQCST